MPENKCKNSVFCVLFLLFFCVGTICGVFAFRCFLAANRLFVINEMAFGFVADRGFLFGQVRVFLRAVVLIALTVFVPYGRRVLLALILIRGFLWSFLICALWMSGCDLLLPIMVGSILLPLYFLLSAWAYLHGRATELLSV